MPEIRCCQACDIVVKAHNNFVQTAFIGSMHVCLTISLCLEYCIPSFIFHFSEKTIFELIFETAPFSIKSFKSDFIPIYI